MSATQKKQSRLFFPATIFLNILILHYIKEKQPNGTELGLTESTAALTGFPIASLTDSDDQNLYRMEAQYEKKKRKKNSRCRPNGLS